MSHEDPTRSPGRAAPSIAFDRAMAGVDTRCRHLTTLLDIGDLGRVEPVARSAANFWLAGRSAYRRLVERDPATSPQGIAARQRLEAAYALLLDILKRAHAQVDHGMRSQLDDLRIDLVTAAVHAEAPREGR